ncbi:MAG TPA: hypothetical protein VGW79_08010, partial [Actinomycetota bacterium]|nr:hypothetical protein [Actinomycetota bacterium]
HIRQMRCAWDGLDALHRRIRELLGHDRASPGSYVNAFAVLAMPTTPADQLAAARNYGRYLAAQVREHQVAPTIGELSRLRVGFVSSDFRDHPMTALMVEFWERIDRGRIEVFAYGIDARSEAHVGRRIERAMEHFVDLSEESSIEVAKRIRADRIAILFDLNGYTRSAKPAIFALRPAPVQINCIGFPGTLGAPWYDYIYTDRFSLPERSRPFYTERPLYMPHMSFPSDTTRLPAGPPPTREACGLPQRGFVFCCFNNAYKILPDVFSLWMRLLQAVPESVLWLLETLPEAKANLCREAVRAGVDPQRLIFAPRAPVGEHVARNAAADLFLDTYPYGAHTTANDALLAGLPVLTCAGDTLVSRIAGSQLHAIGLPELATERLADYERLALTLATQPALLRSYRDRLAAHRATHPLFDMIAYANDFAELVERIWREHAGGVRAS